MTNIDFFDNKIFIQAAEEYPLYAKPANWDSVKNRLYGHTDAGISRGAYVRKNLVNRNYWKRYPIHIQPEKIEHCFAVDVFTSQGKEFELLRFYKNSSAGNILISPGAGSHAYVFAELAYLIYKQGFNVFVMPRQGGYTISQLVKRHEDALEYINKNYGGDVHLYGEGLGGFIIFYLALSGNQNIKTITCENSPAVLTEQLFHEALKNHRAAGKRIALSLPIFKTIGKFFPWLRVPVKTYLCPKELIDNENKTNKQIEEHLVKAYNDDPDFDTHYPLKAILSLLNTQPPKAISTLSLPVMFIVAKRGIIPSYFKNLFDRISFKNKRLVEVDGGVLWMVSNPEEAALLISSWITQQKNQIKNEQSKTYSTI